MSSNADLQRTIIIAVEKWPCLWNRNDKDYMSKNVKEVKWREVKKVIKTNLTGRNNSRNIVTLFDA